MIKPNVLTLTGYGINCDRETQFAFEQAGARSDLVHINDLIENPGILKDYQIFAFPGGFSYGDDTGAGNALANKIRNHVEYECKRFIEDGNLVIGICNGFQVITNLGLLPAFEGNYGKREVALVHNNSARYLCRWVDLEFGDNCVWTRETPRMSLPVAHGEGKFYALPDAKKLKERGMIAARYVEGEICEYQGYDANPNGSLEDIAGITDESGRILGLMPHPERAINFTQLPDWTLRREKFRRIGKELPEEGPGLMIFKNGVNYFS